MRDKWYSPEEESFAIPSLLQEVPAHLLWCPTNEAYEEVALHKFTCGTSHSYMSTLSTLCFQYIDAVCTAMRKHPGPANFLDKPNAHRLLELFLHSVPMYGPARLFTEIPLELAHQQFNEWLENNSHYDSHLSG